MGSVDGIDRTLIRLLRADGRSTYQDLGKRVRLSANTVADRVRRLRSTGVISGVHAELDPAALGRTLVMISDVRLRENADRAEFERGLHGVPQVVSGARVTGDFDYQLRLACVDAAEFEAVIDLMKREHGVRQLRSRLLLHDLDLDQGRLLLL